tara:strand:+ start:7691 stop:8038 length:348 start_codon:yes stop_codon:yes gene_type:complete
MGSLTNYRYGLVEKEEFRVVKSICPWDGVVGYEIALVYTTEQGMASSPGEGVHTYSDDHRPDGVEGLREVLSEMNTALDKPVLVCGVEADGSEVFTEETVNKNNTNEAKVDGPFA